MTGHENTRGLLEAAIEIASRRQERMGRMKAALERGDDCEALKVARLLFGLEYETKTACDRTHPGID
jgi:hypothetical protein